MAEAIRILIVDDDDMVRGVLERVAEELGWAADCASNAEEAVGFCRDNGSYQICLLDVRMPGRSGLDVLPDLFKFTNELAVIMLTGHADVDASVRAMKMGAYDFLLKPVDLVVLEQRIERAIEWRASRLERKLRVHEIERLATQRASELDEVRRAIIFGLVKLTGCRDGETGLHLARMQRYCMEIALGLRELGLHRTLLTDNWIKDLYECSPLHDIGKIGIPDIILRKPGPLSDIEREVMMTHTTIGFEALQQIREKVGAQTFLDMGIEVTRHHHEHWDGHGYPSGLRGTEIPLSARITALADVFDALTVSRIYRSRPFTYEEVCDIILSKRGSHFDPDVVDAFFHRQAQILAVKNELT